MIRGIRGATTVEKNDASEIIEATRKLLVEMKNQNQIKPEAIVSILISMTEDLNAAFPAKALREIDGWKHVPVMCMQEIPVPNSLKKCIRVMLTAETNTPQQNVQHIYHNQAIQLRPDLVNLDGEET